MEIYIAHEEGNCYYFMAQQLLLDSLVESFQGSDLKEKIENLFLEIFEKAGLFLNFFRYLIIAITEHRLDLDFEEVQIPDPPSLSDIKIPYFIRNR